ncbi:hypothetical protein Patl1_32431 [Pistacia atlantica]|uniref:Uncharacterized protein n=1 Tax=Pistacia atlantica TaxID=434234 RepID=A0ACC1AMS0_9ROSI|nr:hypothetical protein Patl1_32431 [Pistacia atlantica]
MLDSQFSQIQALQDSSNPDFVNEVITLFCNDTERIITELNKYMSQQNIDFTKLDSYAHQLKVFSRILMLKFTTLGLKVACVELCQGSERKVRIYCILWLILIYD